MALPTVGGIIPRQVDLCYGRKKTEHARENKSSELHFSQFSDLTSFSDGLGPGTQKEGLYQPASLCSQNSELYSLGQNCGSHILLCAQHTDIQLRSIQPICLIHTYH